MGHRFEVFFDGDCPLCSREIALLRSLDRKQRIRFTDIAAPDFDAAACGKTQAELMNHIHGRLPDGRWRTGVEVFRELYSAVGFGPVVAVSRWSGLRHLLDWGYERFAENRLRWTRRCSDGGCAVGPEVQGLEARAWPALTRGG
jgi:predicted DCC family thiol-disulfide oxidoreductase YuxK